MYGGTSLRDAGEETYILSIPTLPCGVTERVLPLGAVEVVLAAGHPTLPYGVTERVLPLGAVEVVLAAGHPTLPCGVTERCSRWERGRWCWAVCPHTAMWGY